MGKEEAHATRSRPDDSFRFRKCSQTLAHVTVKPEVSAQHTCSSRVAGSPRCPRTCKTLPYTYDRPRSCCKLRVRERELLRRRVCPSAPTPQSQPAVAHAAARPPMLRSLTRAPLRHWPRAWLFGGAARLASQIRSRTPQLSCRLTRFLSLPKAPSAKP